jgi:uncharacterized protein
MAGQSILIAAFSGRAAALAARRSGLVPLVADLFADDDTRALAAVVRHVAGDPQAGFEAGGLIRALGELAAAAPSPPIGVVYGAGFEDRPALLAEIGGRWPLLGNTPETVAAVKDPWRLAGTLSALGIAHPRIAAQALAGWLIKRRGGAGGAHISDGAPVGAGGFYAQERVEGRPVSALFLAGAKGAEIVGFSEQWTAPGADQPYRFGGAVTPAGIDEALADALGGAIRAVAAAFDLKGVNSADFLVGPEDWWLIEINPRLSATLDLFDDDQGRLFAAHLAATRGLPAHAPPPPRGARALQLVYAPAEIPRLPLIDWPDWTADRPRAGSRVPADAPFCTVLATAQTPCEARRLCGTRAGKILKLMGSKQWTTAWSANPVPA